MQRNANNGQGQFAWMTHYMAPYAKISDFNLSDFPGDILDLISQESEESDQLRKQVGFMMLLSSYVKFHSVKKIMIDESLLTDFVEVLSTMFALESLKRKGRIKDYSNDGFCKLLKEAHKHITSKKQYKPESLFDINFEVDLDTPYQRAMMESIKCIDDIIKKT